MSGSEVATVGTDDNHTILDAGTNWSRGTDITTTIRAGMAPKQVRGVRGGGGGVLRVRVSMWFNGHGSILKETCCVCTPQRCKASSRL